VTSVSSFEAAPAYGNIHATPNTQHAGLNVRVRSRGKRNAIIRNVR